MPAAAQMAVTTVGATDGSLCYQNAQNDFSTDTGPCDEAIRDTATSRRDKMKTYVNRGIIYNRKGDLEAAVADFNAALEINDGIAEAYLNRGNSYFLAARYDDALADYEQSLLLEISKPWAAWYNIGLVYDAKKDADKARAAYQKALALNPDFTQARLKLEGRS
jgi:tetratricopeptide (TPR) repeat protein